MTGADAILLDIDGTLVDTTYLHALAWQRAFRAHGRPVEHWRLHRAIGMGGDRLVAHVTDDETEDRLGDALRDAWREEYLELRPEVRPLPGASELVRSLAAADWRVALASSGDPEFSREAVALLGVEDEIELLTTADDVDASKPEPDLLGETLRRMDGVTSAVLVGDTVYDVESAARAGLACVGVLTGGFGRAELDDAGASTVATGPADLLDVDWSAHLRPVG